MTYKDHLWVAMVSALLVLITLVLLLLSGCGTPSIPTITGDLGEVTKPAGMSLSWVVPVKAYTQDEVVCERT